MHTLTTRSGIGEVNSQALKLFVNQSIKQLDNFNRLSSLAVGIKGEADKIITESDELAYELSRHLQSIRRELAGVEAIELVELSEPDDKPECEIE
jgi:hypothetical protein